MEDLNTKAGLEGSKAEEFSHITSTVDPKEALEKAIEEINKRVAEINKSNELAESQMKEVRSKLDLPDLEGDTVGTAKSKEVLDELKKQSQDYINQKESTNADLNSEEMAKLALNKMPEGKQGIVLGVGGNTKEWQERGWKTLDIDPTTGADFIVDANNLEDVIKPGTQDFLFAEAIRFDPLGVEGMGHARLLQQSNLALKMNGELVIKTANFENLPRATVPEKEEFLDLLKQHGFKVVTEEGEKNFGNNNVTAQQIIYYAKKIAEGWDPSRSENFNKKTEIKNDMPNPEPVKNPEIKPEPKSENESKKQPEPKVEPEFKKEPEPAKNNEKPKPLENVKDWANKSFYERLGIPENATTDQINTAFKELAKKYHPDNVASNESLRKNYEEVQKLLGEARNTLLNQTERSKYDSQKEAFKNNFQDKQNERPRESTDKQNSWQNTNYENNYQQKGQQGAGQQNNPEQNQEAEMFNKYFDQPGQFNVFFDVNDIRRRMDSLIRSGFNKERASEMLEAKLVNEFKSFTEDKIFFDIAVPKIKERMNELVSLGVSEGKLQKTIEPIVLESLKDFIKNKNLFKTMSYETEKYAIDIQKKVKLYEYLGVDKQKLNAVASSVSTR